MPTLLSAAHDMYDAIPADIPNIPANPFAVAGYIDSIHYTWSPANWAQFPNALHLLISTRALKRGHFYDREKGDLSAAGAVNAVIADRAAGWNSGIYCNESSWQEVQDAVNAKKITHPPYWIAHYDGVRDLPTLNGHTALLKQYSDVGGRDTSCISQELVTMISGGTLVVGATDMELTDKVTLADTGPFDGSGDPSVNHVLLNVWQNNTGGNNPAALMAAIKDLKSTVTTQFTATSAAIAKGQSTGGVDVAALATALATDLAPHMPSNVTEAQLSAAASAFANALK